MLDFCVLQRMAWNADIPDASSAYVRQHLRELLKCFPPRDTSTEHDLRAALPASEKWLSVPPWVGHACVSCD